MKIKSRATSTLLVVLMLSYGICSSVNSSEGVVTQRTDPFTPLVLSDGTLYHGGSNAGTTTVFQSGAIHLEGIVQDPAGKDSLAIVNGEIIREGEFIAGAQVSEIKHDRIVLLTDEGEVVVNLIK